MPADHANEAAAVTAGYTFVKTDFGATRSPRFRTEVFKAIGGDAQSGESAHLVAEAVSDVSQAAADATALLQVNGFRQHRYGRDAANVNKGRTGSTLTTDVS